LKIPLQSPWYLKSNAAADKLTSNWVFVKDNCPGKYAPKGIFKETWSGLPQRVQMQSSSSVFLRVVKKVLSVIAILFVTYSVIFSVVVTSLCIYGAIKIGTPIMEIKKLASVNPAETLYMRNVLKESGDSALIQTFVPLDSISPLLLDCVLAAEDDGFYQHPGFDLNAMVDALEYNKAHNSAKRGASTITQQLAKNLFTGGEKNFKRKYEELAYAIMLEWFLGKDRILELYMNYAQWGKNVFGCEAAAQLYFHKSCKAITLEEAARMAAILAKPSSTNPHSKTSTFLQKRIGVIANNLFLRNRIDTSTLARMADTVVPVVKADTAIAAIKTDSLSIIVDTAEVIHPDTRKTRILFSRLRSARE
jgi:monofunctional biosynthetic peptidoglycan transglycosylase